MLTNCIKRPTSILLAPLFFLAALPAFSQTVVPSDEEPTPAKKEKPAVVLNREQLELTREYLAIVEQVQKLTADYARYMKSYNGTAASKYLKAIEEFRTQMLDSEHFVRVDKLRAEIRRLHEELAVRKLNGKSAESAKLSKLAYNLAKELQSTNELIALELSEENGTQKEAIAKLSEQIAVIVRQATAEAKAPSPTYFSGDSVRVLVQVAGADSNPIYVAIPRLMVAPELAYVDIPVTPETPAVPSAPSPVGVGSIPAPPTPPPPGVTVIDRGIIHRGRDGDVTMKRTFADSSGELSTSSPIQIMNPIGNVEISGWNSNYVRVTLQQTITSKDFDRAAKVAHEMNLHLYLQDNTLLVSPEIPRISDPATSIADNLLKVRVPMANKVACQSSFGAVKVHDLENGLTLSTENTTVLIDHVQGEIRMANSSGTVNVSDCDGTINVKNSMGTISVSGSSGTIELHNSFAATKVFDCTGDLFIKGEGQVEVTDHEGDVRVENRNGQVRIVRLNGDTQVRNANAPSILSYINGSADVENLNANIQAEAVSGLLTARNKYAPIVISSSSGPLDLSNEGGDIGLVLNDQINGDSKIQATSGLINIKLLKNQDLVFTVEAINGDINCMLPLQIDTSGRDKKLKHIFGSGINKLAVTSNSGKVLISGDR